MQHSELCFNKPANSSVATRRWGKTFRLIAHPASKLVDPPGSSPDVHPFPVTRGTPPHIESLQRAERNEPLRSLPCTALQRRLSTATYCSIIVFVRCVTPRAAMHAHRSKTARRSAAALPRRCRRSRRKPNRQGRPSSSAGTFLGGSRCDAAAITCDRSDRTVSEPSQPSQPSAFLHVVRLHTSRT